MTPLQTIIHRPCCEQQYCNTEISIANIYKTRQLTLKQSRLINNSTGKRKNMCFWFYFGVNCPFKCSKTHLITHKNPTSTLHRALQRPHHKAVLAHTHKAAESVLAVLPWRTHINIPPTLIDICNTNMCQTPATHLANFIAQQSTLLALSSTRHSSNVSRLRSKQ